MKIFAFFLMMAFPFAVSAATACNQIRTDCRYFIDDAGALVDRKDNERIVDIDSNDSFADVSILKYGDQYVLIKENTSNNRVLVAIPIEEINGGLGYSAAFYFSIDLIASTGRSTPVWNAQRVAEETAHINSMIWKNAEPTDRWRIRKSVPTVPTNGWPSMSVSFVGDVKQPASSKCFAPYSSDSDHFPIADFACRFISLPITNGPYDLSGIIGKRMLISMHLEKNSNILVGWYKYNSGSGSRIKLEGYISDMGEFKINEYGSAPDRITGSFSGQIRNGAFVGNWRSSDSKKTFTTIFYQQGFS